MIHTVETEFAGKPLVMETGRMARQAGGAVYLLHGDTALLATAVASRKPRPGMDFFPLMVDYREKLYAAGKIPGGFFRREGRSTSRETLISRVIDRPLRPLFPSGFRNDVNVSLNVLSADKEQDPDILAILGASACLGISPIPFEGPVAGVRIGRVDEKYVINPSYEDLEISDLDLVLVGSKEAIVMVEGSAVEVPEESVIEALLLGFKELQVLNEAQEELFAKAAKEKKEFTCFTVPEEIAKEVEEKAIGGISDALSAKVSKLEREAQLSEAKSAFMESLPEDLDEDSRKKYSEAVSTLTKKLIRKFIKDTQERLDGRGLSDIRPISCEVNVLPRAHGSALFTRGETQALAVITLGTSDDEQIVDDITDIDKRTFLLHYNFPSFSVGETGPNRGPGRREIGHGFLAEKALVNVVPPTEDFPYTIRIVSEILESNGSSSMASVCAGSLALFDAGVQISAAVSGIAMGLLKEGDDFVILSDIAGWEDHAGDMDFKVAGTEHGITAIQMDIKVKGISEEILKQALYQAKDGRAHIASKMAEALASPRAELSPNAPRVIQIPVPQDKIKDVIGPGGKMIKSIVEETGCKIDIGQDGICNIFSQDLAMANRAKEIIESLTEEPEIGRRYKGTVKRVENYGAFVEIIPGRDGLLHVSQFPHRVEDMFQELSLGDNIEVMVVDIDPEGKVRLSQRFDEPLEELANPRRGGGGGGGGPRGGRGGDRGGRGGGRGGDRGGRGGDRGGRGGRRRD